jgi:hypothetical protein
MRLVLLGVALAGFIGLGLLDITAGNTKPGVAALLLAVANGLLLVR